MSHFIDMNRPPSLSLGVVRLKLAALVRHLESLSLWLLPASSAVEFIPRRVCPAVLFVSAFCSEKGEKRQERRQSESRGKSN